jgi:hypothetical protein
MTGSRSSLVQSAALLRASILILTLTFLCACGGPDPTPWPKIISGDPQPTPDPVARASDHLVVYLDTSGSMAGYVSPDGQTNFAAAPDGQTVFSHTLQEVRNVVTTLDPRVSVVFRRVAAKVEPPSFNDLELGQASVNRSAFNGGETNLAGAFDLFAQPLRAPRQEGARKERGAGEEGRGGQGSDDEDEPLPARFHILITDGVQSTKQHASDESCVAGSDYICVKKAIAKLLDAGWGGCVLGVRSEFHGKLFSEINHGKAIPYETKRSDPKTFRPFYLYVFSPDRAALDKLVEALKAGLRSSLKQEDALREYALTSRYADGAGSAEVVIPKESAGYLERMKAREENPPRLTLMVDLNTEKKGPQPFSISVAVPWSGHAKDGGSPQELAGLLRWELEEIHGDWDAPGGGRRYPEVKLTGQQSDEQGRVVAQATAQWPQGTGKPGWRAYKLVGRLDLDKLSPPWVRQWSTNVDTTTDVANRTLNLESSLAGLWHNPAMEKQVVAEVYLRVGPE